MNNIFLVFILFFVLQGCRERNDSPGQKVKGEKAHAVLAVLGNVQDGGSPHIGCRKKCCSDLFKKPDPERTVSCLGVYDQIDSAMWIFDATPDLPRQLRALAEYSGLDEKRSLKGIFLSHAHIGHYTGLMYLGREAMGSKGTTVYAMPRMCAFLTNNGPWSQLVSLSNITLSGIHTDASIELSPQVAIQTFTVPHRDEFSETVGFIIRGKSKSAMFIPDIDKWGKWHSDLTTAIKKVDYAFIDGTFFDSTEVAHRSMSEIPHPFVVETMRLLQTLPAEERAKVFFIHLNHTNPLLEEGSEQNKEVARLGYQVARPGMKFEL
jgi:pyrroloquinoline quinone biosynthesis protein B